MRTNQRNPPPSGGEDVNKTLRMNEEQVAAYHTRVTELRSGQYALPVLESPRDKRRPARLTRVEPAEAQVCRGIEDVLRLATARGQVAWWAKLNSGAWKDEDRFVRCYRLFGVDGLEDGKSAGLPDYLAVLAGGTPLWIEAKRPSGRVRRAQERFISHVKGHGGRAVVIRDGAALWGELA